MKISSDIETMILDLTRQGKTARYILMGFRQYLRWEKELEQKGMDSPVKSKGQYMGCDVIICSSDIIEVVTDPSDQLKLLTHTH